jgi:hypothetical protein
MPPDDRSDRFTMRVTPEEKQMITALAERDGLSASDYLRLLVRRTHEAAFGAERTRRKSGKANEAPSGTHAVGPKRSVRHG